MSAGLAYDANLRRGQALRASGRYQDACRFLGEAIQADPDQPQAYLELALAQLGLPGRKKESLQAADQAVARAPNSAHFLGYKAYLLSNYARYKEALDFAGRALQLTPTCYIALVAQCNAYTKTGRWPEAEFAARRILELNAEDIDGMNLLAQALRFRGRHVESRKIVAQILARVPNNAFGHANAGYDALKVNDHRRANEHFLQALQFDPTYDHARRGLLQSLRARCLVYRMNSRVVTWLGDRSTIFGRLVVVACVMSGGLLLVPVLFYFAMAFTLQPLSNLFLLVEPMGRRSLRRPELRWAQFTGLCAALLLVALAIIHQWILLAIIAGYLALFALSVCLPQWRDARQTRREATLLVAGSSSDQVRR